MNSLFVTSFSSAICLYFVTYFIWGFSGNLGPVFTQVKLFNWVNRYLQILILDITCSFKLLSFQVEMKFHVNENCDYEKQS